MRKGASHVQKSLSWLSWVSVFRSQERKKEKEKKKKEERGARGADWAMRVMVRGDGQSWGCCNCDGRFSIPVEHVGRGIRQFLEKCWIESAVRVYNVSCLSRALASVSQSFYFLSLSSAPLLSPSIRSPGYSFTFRLPFYLALVSLISVPLAEFCRSFATVKQRTIPHRVFRPARDSPLAICKPGVWFFVRCLIDRGDRDGKRASFDEVVDLKRWLQINTKTSRVYHYVFRDISGLLNGMIKVLFDILDVD